MSSSTANAAAKHLLNAATVDQIVLARKYNACHCLAAYHSCKYKRFTNIVAHQTSGFASVAVQAPPRASDAESLQAGVRKLPRATNAHPAGSVLSGDQCQSLISYSTDIVLLPPLPQYQLEALAAHVDTSHAPHDVPTVQLANCTKEIFLIVLL